MATEQQIENLNQAANSIAQYKLESFKHPLDTDDEFKVVGASIDLVLWLAQTIVEMPIEYLMKHLGEQEAKSCNQLLRHWIPSLGNLAGSVRDEGRPQRANSYQQFSIAVETRLRETQAGFYFLYLAHRYSQSSTRTEGLERKAEELTSKAEQTIERAAEAENAMREAAGSAGVSVFAEHFEKQADTLGDQANRWLSAAFCIGIVAGGFGWWLANDFQKELSPVNGADLSTIVGMAFGKTVILALLFAALTWCGRSYRALKHQESVNRHRETGLRTFKAFVEGSKNPAVRDAVLLATTKSIFGNMPTGFVDHAGADASDMNIVEVVKEASKTTGGRGG